MNCIATLATRSAAALPAPKGSQPRPSFPAYERLQQGERDVSLRAILGENPMLGVTIAQQINSGSVEVLDVAIDPLNRGSVDLRLRLRGRDTARLTRAIVAMDGSGSRGHVGTTARVPATRPDPGSGFGGSADWTLHMLLRDLQDANAALDARLGAGDDWELLLDDDLAVDRVGRSEPVLLAWDTTEPAGRERLTIYEAWPRGWKRHLALLTAALKAAARVAHVAGHRRVPVTERAVRTLTSTLPLRTRRLWSKSARLIPV